MTVHLEQCCLESLVYYPDGSMIRSGAICHGAGDVRLQCFVDKINSQNTCIII